MSNKAFLTQEPPPGYVAGIGRGATGFVTGADTGALRNLRSFEDLDSDDNNNVNDIGTLSTRGKDDEEADRIYESVERRLNSRKQKRSVAETANDNDNDEKFNGLKSALTKVTQEEWINLPEAMDFTKRNKRQRLLEQLRQRFYATPDNIIASQAHSALGITTTLQTETSNDVNDMGPEIDLDDRKADLDRTRAILSSLRKSEPFKASSWLASARLEIQAKKFNTAKRLITEGCKKLPHNESLWLESIDIHQLAPDGTKMAKILVTEALKYNTRSEKLWIKAYDLENPNPAESRVRILMKGIEFLPNSVELWQRLIELQTNKDDVKKVLTKVVELCPNEWLFWLALINLLDYTEAKALLNKARKTFSTDTKQIWITAAKLEERENPNKSQPKIDKLITKAVTEIENSLAFNVTRKDWLEEATKAESEGFLSTCKAIIFATMNVEILQEDSLSVFFNEAAYYNEQGHFQTASFICMLAVKKTPNDIPTWIRFFQVVQAIKAFQEQYLYGYFQKAIDLNPKEGIFYLMLAKYQWKIENDISGARKTLKTALDMVTSKEEVMYAKIKFELKLKNYDLLEEACQELLQLDKNPRLYYKYIHIKRCLNKLSQTESTDILQVVNTALLQFPEEERIYLQKGQILYDSGDFEAARECYSNATKILPNSINLWLLLSRINEELNSTVRARSEIDRAILNNPQSDLVWLEKIQLEVRNKNIVVARQICSKALKLFPKSPYIWIQHLSLIPKMSHRKNVFLDALKATDNSSTILLHIGIFFWVDGKIAKARSWFDRALDSDSTNGDIWGWLYNFFTQNEDEESLQKFKDKFFKEEDFINRGHVWNSVAKAVTNFDKDQWEILKLVAEKLKQISTI